jgi:hypothetical protein
MMTPVPSTAWVVRDATNVGFDWLELSRSEDAQQLSACAWVITRTEPGRDDSPVCIGHSSAQHAMRVSGVGIHPAQTAALPAPRANMIASAERRLSQCITALKDAGYAVNCQTGSVQDRPEASVRPCARVNIQGWVDICYGQRAVLDWLIMSRP